jgi:tetratricopeptide (TPR) repeat protein
MANKGHGECYVDKSRGIAMSSGAMDVKETMAEYEDQIAMTGKLSGGDLLNLHILIEQAAYELRQHKPEQALSYLKAGLRKDKACIEMLELKGKCYIDMNLYREALDAADEILIGLRENTNSTALAVKASALYNLGDFEHALMSFHR